MCWGADLQQAFVYRFELIVNGGERFAGHQSGNRQRQARQDLAVLDDGETALQVLERFDCCEHVFVIRPDDNHIMRVVRYGCRDGAVLEA